MKFVTAIVLAWIFSMNIAISKNVPVTGDWLLTKLESAQNVKDIYAPVTFQSNGDFTVMDMKMGTWEYHKKLKTVKIISDRFKAASGDNKIIRLKNNEMILENNGTKMYFLRMDKNKILNGNNKSGLMGTWKINTGDSNIIRFITFSSPDVFSYVEIMPGVTTNGKGTWIFNKKDNSLLMIARIEWLDNNYTVKELSENGFILEHENGTLKVSKVKTATNIERLNFKEDDFYDNDGNFKYEKDEEKLPWKEVVSMEIFLKNIHRLTYKYATLIPEMNIFRNRMLTANVSVNQEEQKVCIDFIFNGYDIQHLPEDTELPPNCVTPDDYYNKLFPEKEVDYRFTGKKQITTPAGTFNCTIIEAIGNSGQKYKMWMINNKPGVYAKIIEENPDKNFGYYHVYELQRIK